MQRPEHEVIAPVTVLPPSLAESLRGCIVLAEGCTAEDERARRSRQRVLALLWSALDELAESR